MIEISKDEISDKMFFIREEDSYQPVAVIKVADLLEKEVKRRMIIEIPNENSIVKWKNDDKDEWKIAEISDLIKAYERPQGDLISREALKETIIKICGKCSNVIREYKDGVPDGNCAIQHIMNMIDNAPTIKTFTLEDIEEQYRKGLEKGLSEWETERPQGEWIFNKEMSITCSLWNCSVCNKLNGNDSFNFCPNCGAKMGKYDSIMENGDEE